MVRVCSWIALALSLTGAYLVFTTETRRVTDQLGLGLGVAAVGLLDGAGCLWHQRRFLHERGQVAAVTAFALGVGTVLLGLRPYVWS